MRSHGRPRARTCECPCQKSVCGLVQTKEEIRVSSQLARVHAVVPFLSKSYAQRNRDVRARELLVDKVGDQLRLDTGDALLFTQEIEHPLRKKKGMN